MVNLDVMLTHPHKNPCPIKTIYNFDETVKFTSNLLKCHVLTLVCISSHAVMNEYKGV